MVGRVPGVVVFGPGGGEVGCVISWSEGIKTSASLVFIGAGADARAGGGACCAGCAGWGAVTGRGSVSAPAAVMMGICEGGGGPGGVEVTFGDVAGGGAVVVAVTAPVMSPEAATTVAPLVPPKGIGGRPARALAAAKAAMEASRRAVSISR